MGQYDDNTITVEHAGVSIDIPRVIERSDLNTHFGDVPDEFEVDRAFIYEGNIRIRSYQGDGEWVEGIYQSKEFSPAFNASEPGWVAEVIHAPEDADQLGETVWERD